MRRGRLQRVALAIALAGGMMLVAPVPAAREAPRGSEVAAAGRILVLLPLPPPHFRGRSDHAGSYGDELGRSARRRLVERIAREEGLTLAEAWVMPIVGVDCFVMDLPPGRSAQAAAAKVSGRSGVAWAEPMAEYHLQGAAPGPAPAGRGDPLLRAQPAARVWRLAELHQSATGRDVRVAVIDSMVDAGHPDLAGQVAARENLAPGAAPEAEAHGTGVAGIIAARADNGQGIAGVAPEARLLALRACRETGARWAAECDTLSLARALVSAIGHQAQVINLSLSGPPAPLLGRLLDAALARGVVVVAAYDPALPAGGFPASHHGVVAVSDAAAPPASGVFLAPGRDVPTTEPGGRWGLVDGSSYAAAHVSGLFALMRERRGAAAGRLSLVPASQDRSRIDACASLIGAGRPCDCACAHPEGLRAAAG